MKEIVNYQNIYKSPGIAPRLRPGEVLPEAQPGKVPTRFHGEIVLVSAPGPGETLYNNSPYTATQLAELNQIYADRAASIKAAREVRISENEGIRAAQQYLIFDQEKKDAVAIAEEIISAARQTFSQAEHTA